MRDELYFKKIVGICHGVGCGRIIDSTNLDPYPTFAITFVLNQDFGIGGNFMINKDVSKKKTVINLIFLVTFTILLI